MTTEVITNSVTTLLSVGTEIIDFITGNALLALVLVGGTLLPLGFHIFTLAKGTAR